MKYLKVKGVDKPFSQLVLGTVWFDTDKLDQIIPLMDAYVEKGGTVIETGKFYGPRNQAEWCIKEWFEHSGKREDVMFIDKCCHPIMTPDNQHHPEYWRVKPDLITEDLYWALFHTGCKYLDVFLLHRDDETVPVGPIMDRLEQHREEGLIKAYGVSNWSEDRIQEAVDYCNQKGYQGISMSSNSFSLAKVNQVRTPRTRYLDEDAVKWYEDKDIVLLSWAAQACGFFADIWHDDDKTPQWIKDTYFSENNFERLRRAKVLAELKGCEPINIAAAYVFCRDFPVGAAIGPMNVKELTSSWKASEIELTPQEENYLCLKSDSYM